MQERDGHRPTAARTTTRKGSKAARKPARKKKTTRAPAKKKAGRKTRAPARAAAPARKAKAKATRVRRSREDVVAAALERARKGPFSSRDLARDVGFTPNRARQLLEELKDEGTLVPLGKRRGGRGKPSTLWGFPGTKVTAADQVRKAKPAPVARKAPGAGGGFVDRLFAALERGLRIEDDQGNSWVVRLQ